MVRGVWGTRVRLNKSRAKKCSDMFQHRNIVVTAKHAYAIAYKYIWHCTGCGLEYRRHSKSVDPERHRCGGCKAKLIQTQPAPRTTGPSAFSLYIKEHFPDMKKAHPSSAQRDIMRLLGEAYKAQKAVGPASRERGDDTHAREDKDVVTDGRRGEGLPATEEALDGVSRKLDVLRLERS